jgi:hypothetical protein
MFTRLPTLTLTAAAVVLSLHPPAHATEFGQTHIDLAFQDQLTGVPLPPGFYVRDDVQYVYSNEYDDRNGNPATVNTGVFGKLPLKFYQSSVADVITLAYKSPYTIPVINASVGTAAYVAYAGSRAEAQYTLFGTPTNSGQDRRGLDDFTIVPAFLQWAVPDTDTFFTLSPFEFTAPTGQYNHNDAVGNNIGLNYWSYRPALEFTYLNNNGQEADINYNMSFNSQNNATKYKSGDELSFTYVLEQHFSRPLAVGVEGYFYTQFTNDTQNGVVVNTVPSTSILQPFDPLNAGPGDRGQTFAIGPVVNYQPTAGLVFNLHYEHEVYAINRPRHEVVWARVGFKF